MPMIDADGCLLNVSVDGRDDEPTSQFWRRYEWTTIAAANAA